MQKDANIIESFRLLGLSEECTFGELDDAYKDLSMKYKADRFMEGEAGAEAARNLEKIEIAYGVCQDYLKSRADVSDISAIYTDISQLIKAGDLKEAQDKLDSLEYRDAEWHFYQSIVYYKNNWFDDSKKQLEICINLEPNNQKYNDAMKNLTESMAKSNPYQNTQQEQSQAIPNMDAGRAGYPPPNAAPSTTQTCCDTCCCLAWLDTCCECCGGDLCNCC